MLELVRGDEYCGGECETNKKWENEGWVRNCQILKPRNTCGKVLLSKLFEMKITFCRHLQEPLLHRDIHHPVRAVSHKGYVPHCHGGKHPGWYLMNTSFTRPAKSC